MYDNSFHKKFVDAIKNKWIVMYMPNRNKTSSLYYITGARGNEWGYKSLEGYRIILNQDNTFNSLDLLNDYDVSLDDVLYSVEVEDEESINYLNLQIAKHILL